MSGVGHCIDNGPIEGLWGIIKSEMYQMYEITDESSLRHAVKDYIKFYSEEYSQDRYYCKTPLGVRTEAMTSDQPMEYPIPSKSYSQYVFSPKTSRKTASVARPASFARNSILSLLCIVITPVNPITI